ncbi:MAG: zinc ribbon domain-containing protein [Atopobiaceae bacterium]|nr:zinc ribbon domain-containing protein [Atopobiaceae bacterium]
MARGDMERKLAEWLRGRNGTDELSTCALVLAVVLVGLNILLRSFVVSVIALVLMAYAWWRMSSKNLEARENENGVFVESLGPLRPWIRNPAKAMAEARAYKHIKCPECGQRVRVPRGKGKVRITCPKCRHTYEARA